MPLETRKVEDTNFLPVAKGGRLDQHYGKHPIRDFANKRQNIRNIPDPTAQSYRFNLKGFEFGNWATNEDRANFMETAVRSLPTFANVIGIKSAQVGLSFHVGIAYGARGQGPALAHYEPGTGMINLTRYPDGMQRKFFTTGGMRSFAHEWGHALDYFLGTYLDQRPDSRALSLGNKVVGSINSWKHFENLKLEKGSYRWIMREILAAILFSERGKTWSPYYAGMRKAIEQNPFMGTYWLRLNELFARCFEQYVSLKAKGKNLKNSFLTKEKYTREELGRKRENFNPYMNIEHLKRVEPWIDKLLKKATKDIPFKA